MTAPREDVLKPAWTRDQVNSLDPPDIEPAYFDSNLQAWVLSRHGDLLAAFHAPSLIQAAANSPSRVWSQKKVSASRCGKRSVGNFSVQVRAGREKLESMPIVPVSNCLSRIQSTLSLPMRVRYASTSLRWSLASPE